MTHTHTHKILCSMAPGDYPDESIVAISIGDKRHKVTVPAHKCDYLFGIYSIPVVYGVGYILASVIKQPNGHVTVSIPSIQDRVVLHIDTNEFDAIDGGIDVYSERYGA